MLRFSSYCLCTDHVDMVKEFHARFENPKLVKLEWKPPRKPGIIQYLVSDKVAYLLTCTVFTESLNAICHNLNFI